MMSLVTTAEAPANKLMGLRLSMSRLSLLVDLASLLAREVDFDALLATACERLAKALRAGASGFLGKDVSAEGLLAGIRTVADGDTLLSPLATRSLISRFLATPEPSRPDSPRHLAALTDREREVMALAALGRSNDEIAAHLVVSPLTVRSHIHRAMTKLHARDRAQLVVIAYQTGLVRADPPPPAR